MFGLFFVGASYPIPAANLQQVDATHWVLDVCTAVRSDYWELKDVALFLAAPIDAGAAVGLYVRSGSSEWLYRGAVFNGHPSEAMPLQWPLSPGGEPAPPGPGAAQIGVSVEPLPELAGKEGSRLGDRLDYSRRVAGDFVRFMQSYPTRVVDGGEVMLVPANVMALWLAKFEAKFKRDPEFLTRRQEVD